MDRLKKRHLLEDQLRTATQALAAGLITRLTVAEIEQARQWTGLEFLQPSLMNSLEAERGQLEIERRELEQEPDFHTDPQIVRDQAEQERQRIKDHQAALLPLLRTCLGHPRFTQLLRSGFGTPKYGCPFWRMSFYRDRQAADEICKRTNHKTFSSLLDDYHSANQAYESLENKLEGLSEPPPTSRQRWTALGRRITHMEQIHLNTVHTRITLALLKGGSVPVWADLEQADLPDTCNGLYQKARSLRDLLEQMMQD